LHLPLEFYFNEAGSVILKDLDITDQPNGIYTINISSGNRQLLNEKVLINK